MPLEFIEARLQCCKLGQAFLSVCAPLAFAHTSSPHAMSSLGSPTSGSKLALDVIKSLPAAIWLQSTQNRRRQAQHFVSFCPLFSVCALLLLYYFVEEAAIKHIKGTVDKYSCGPNIEHVGFFVQAYWQQRNVFSFFFNAVQSSVFVFKA